MLTTASASPATSVAVVGGAIVFCVTTTFLLLPRLFAAKFYDCLIIRMTRVWYREVLQRVNEGDNILDVGIGTGTALLDNFALLQKRKLSVFGVDYDQNYIDLGRKQIADKLKLHDPKTLNTSCGAVRLTCRSIFDVKGIVKDHLSSSMSSSTDVSSCGSPEAANVALLNKDKQGGEAGVDVKNTTLQRASLGGGGGGQGEQDEDQEVEEGAQNSGHGNRRLLLSEEERFDVAYFSGSFTLLPDPVEALALVKQHFLKKETPTSRIYITQTFQKKHSPITAFLKPLLRYAGPAIYVTTIDFGVLTYERDLDEILQRAKTCGLEVVSNEPIPNSINTQWQVAKIICLRCVD